jgi:hypothetical protein
MAMNVRKLSTDYRRGNYPQITQITQIKKNQNM